MPRVKSRQKAKEPPADDAAMEDAPTSHQPAEEDPFQDDEMEAEAEDEAPDPQRVRILPGSTPTAASFEFLEEGHTLGNALRYVIMKNPEVEFCAYVIPHPSEPKMNVRIQTTDATTAIEALEKGLKDMQDLCDVVAEKFWAEREAFADQMET